MSEDRSSDGGVAPETPDPVSEWLSRMAEERDLTEEELLDRVLSAAEDPGSEGPSDDREGGRLDELEREFDGKIEDVRERVIQVKREADGKAPAEHDHPEIEERLGERLDRLANEVRSLQSSLDRVENRFPKMESRIAKGFENYEEVLEYLTEATDDLQGRLDTLARAVAELRRRSAGLAAAEQRRAAAESLAAEANRHGIREAECDDCGESVDIGLLSEPRCPHCEAGFDGIEPKSGFFGSHTLRAGTPPALDGEVEPPDDDLSGIVEGESEPIAAARGAIGDSDADGDSSGDADAGAPEDPVGAVAAPGDADGDDPGDDGGTSAEAEPGDATEPEGDRDAASVGGGDLESIDGIGSTYAERLRESGVETVAALADADPEALVDATNAPRSVVEEWIEQAERPAG